MNRRWFLGASLAAVGSVFVPKFEGWYKAGSGVLVPETPKIVVPEEPVLVARVPMSVFTEYQLHLLTQKPEQFRRWLNANPLYRVS